MMMMAGSMNLHFLKAISEHCKSVTNELEIMDYLTDCGDLSIEEAEFLLDLEGKRNTIQVLLYLMSDGNEKLYRDFVRALLSTDQEEIAFKLMTEELIHHPIYE